MKTSTKINSFATFLMIKDRGISSSDHQKKNYKKTNSTVQMAKAVKIS